MSLLKYVNESFGANIVHIRVIDEDLRENGEIFQELESNSRVRNFELVPGTINSIRIWSNIDAVENMHEFTELIVEPLRQLGYDVRVTHLG